MINGKFYLTFFGNTRIDKVTVYNLKLIKTTPQRSFNEIEGPYLV